MAHRLGIATVCLSGTLEDKPAAAAAAGFAPVRMAAHRRHRLAQDGTP